MTVSSWLLGLPHVSQQGAEEAGNLEMTMVPDEKSLLSPAQEQGKDRQRLHSNIFTATKRHRKNADLSPAHKQKLNGEPRLTPSLGYKTAHPLGLW